MYTTLIIGHENLNKKHIWTWQFLIKGHTHSSLEILEYNTKKLQQKNETKMNPAAVETKSRKNNNMSCKEPRTYDQTESIRSFACLLAHLCAISQYIVNRSSWKPKDKKWKNEKSTQTFMEKNVCKYENDLKAYCMCVCVYGLQMHCDFALESQSLAFQFSIQSLLCARAHLNGRAT